MFRKQIDGVDKMNKLNRRDVLEKAGTVSSIGLVGILATGK